MTVWNSEIIESVTADFGADHLATRTAKRIADKGFSLVDVKKVRGAQEGFNWGRSSFGETRNTLYIITFENDKNEEFGVTVASQVITYTKRNPYDHMPAGNGKESFTVRPHDEASKAVLGWKGA